MKRPEPYRIEIPGAIFQMEEKPEQDVVYILHGDHWWRLEWKNNKWQGEKLKGVKPDETPWKIEE